MKGGVTLEDIKEVRGKGIMTIEGRIRKGKEGKSSFLVDNLFYNDLSEIVYNKKMFLIDSKGFLSAI